MLALTRRPGESIIIGDNIEVKILGISGKQIRIGINAPIDVSVHREEIYLKTQERKENNEDSDNEGNNKERAQ